MKKIEDIPIRDVICRIMPKLDKAIDKIIKPNNKKLFNKKLYLNGQNSQGYEPPIYTSAYYKYKHIAKNKNHNVNINSMDLNNFFKICKFTNVSADYYLGFRESTRTEPSAPTVKEDFGLSDKAMGNLREIKKMQAFFQGELSTDLVNMVLENKDFWDKFGKRLAAYIACIYGSGRAEMDVESARYVLIKAFEELVDDLVQQLYLDDRYIGELDLTGAFATMKDSNSIPTG